MSDDETVTVTRGMLRRWAETLDVVGFADDVRDAIQAVLDAEEHEDQEEDRRAREGRADHSRGDTVDVAEFRRQVFADTSPDPEMAEATALAPRSDTAERNDDGS